MSADFFAGFGDAAAGFGAGFLVVYFLVIYFFTFAVTIANYVLGALGLSAIARRRGLQKTWMAWVPFLDARLMGTIADQYENCVMGYNGNYRKRFFVWQIVLVASSFVIILISTIFAVGAIVAETASGSLFAEDWVMGFAGLVLILCLAIIVLCILYIVVYYKVLCRIFRSCKPSLAVLFALLATFCSAGGILLFLMRKKDEGMIPMAAAQPEGAWQQQ